MLNESKPISTRPGRLTGSLSLACFVISSVGTLVAATLASERFAAAGTAPGGGGLQDALMGGLIVLGATTAATASCILGLVFGLTGIALAWGQPLNVVRWPALGVALNGLPLLGVSLLILYLWMQ
jgi:hypothetical protein